MKNNKIFITGGAGFLGCALSKRLLDEGYDVVVFDNFSNNNLKYYNNFAGRNFLAVDRSVLNFDSLLGFMSGADIVIHMAAMAGVDNIIKNSVETMKVNIEGTFNVLKAATIVDGLKLLLNFSTSEIFGEYTYKQQEEDTAKIKTVGNARWVYSISKLAGEYIAQSYYREFGVPIVNIRPFNIYGPRQSSKGVIHNFVIKAINNENLIVYNDGSQIRSWCYIDDFIDGIMLILASENNKVVGESFNLGNPKETTTIYGFAENVISVANSESLIEFTERNIDDVELRIPNINKAKRVLGFCPKVSLKEGLGKTIKWYREEYDG